MVLFLKMTVRLSNSIKNKGFIIDKHFKTDLPVNAIVSHCYKLFGDVRRNRHLLSNDSVKIIVHSIIGSRIDYCNGLFCGIDKNVIGKLQKLQNSAARIISQRKKRDSVKGTFGETTLVASRKKNSF